MTVPEDPTADVPEPDDLTGIPDLTDDQAWPDVPGPDDFPGLPIAPDDEDDEDDDE
jgi:hypothetical protein